MNTPKGVHAIPAMTSEAERRCFYLHTVEQNHHGYVVELGAWLGAATAWIAAGVRDSGVDRQAHVYDRFKWNPNQHNRKAGGPLKQDMLCQFRENLGPLLQYVVPHKCEVEDIKWDYGNVSLIVFDAPKRSEVISEALTIFADWVYSGTILAWQDFTHSASFDIPATMSRLGGKVEFVEAVPGSTVVLRVLETWDKSEVTREALARKRWRPKEIEDAWDRWLPHLPEEMAAHFLAGKAMFLCEAGAHDRARAIIREVLHKYGDTIVPKWREMKTHRASYFVQRFAPLFNEMQRHL